MRETSRPLLLVDRYHPRLRRELQTIVDAGRLQQCEQVALLEPPQLRPLAQLSLTLLLSGVAFFLVLDLFACFWQQQPLFGSVTIGSVLLWLVLNILGYFLILPIHELIHALVFAFWGGKPHLGTKLPLALYCGARNQLFHRDHYLTVALAPVLVLSLAGIILIFLSPGLTSYAFFAFVGNLSGAAGDLLVASHLLRQSPHILVEDTESGYTTWKIAPEA